MKIDLLQMVEHGGCSAKISPKQLEEILKYLPLPQDPNILVDIDTHDDAGVYKVNDELALVLTTDFFPPVCSCLLYTSDAADDLTRVDLGGRRIIKKKKK